LKASLAKALYMKESDIDEGKPFIDMGLDSIVGVEWIKAINQEFKTNINATIVYDYPTIKELAYFLYKGISNNEHFSLTQQQNIQENITSSSKQVLERFSVGKVRKKGFVKQWLLPKHENRFKELYFNSHNYQGYFEEGGEISIQYMINPENNICLSEHIVFGEYMFPTDGYIELVCSACKIFFQIDYVILTNIIIVNPLIGLNNKNIFLRVVFQTYEDRVQFNVKSSFSPNYENERIHMKGFIVSNTTHDKNVSRYKCNTDFTIEKELDAVETMNKLNIIIGKFYSTIQKWSFGDNAALGHIQVFNHGLKFFADPSIIFAGLVTTITYGSYHTGKQYEINEDIFLPYSMENVSIPGSIIESSYLCYAEIEKVEKDWVELYFEIIDQAFDPIFIVEKIRLQRVSRRTIQQQALAVKNTELINNKNTSRIENLLSRDIVVSGSTTDVAIIGMSCRYPMSENVDAFWNNLKEGKDCITEVPSDRWNGYKNWYHPDPEHTNTAYSKWGGFIENVDTFDPLFFGISPAEAENMDPQQRIFLEESWKAIEYAGYSPDSLGNQSCGVYVGCAAGDYRKVLESQGQDTVGSSFTGTSSAILASRISYSLNLKGPSMAIDTACSSSLTAIHFACESIRNQDNQLALAGGINLLLSPLLHILTSQVGMQAKDGKCHSFAESASGSVFSEGCGVILLKSLQQAKIDGDPILGIIKASGINQDGKTNGITAPSSVSQEQLLIQTYKKNGIDPAKISYVEAHGTGTPLGDPIEVNALNEAFQKFTPEKNYCALGSVKSNLGHSVFAAGICGVIKVLLCMKYGKLVPSINYKKHNPHIHFEESPFYVNTRYKDWESKENEPRLAAVSSFGFSGTNAHLVIEEAFPSFSQAEPIVSASAGGVPLLIPLSAKNKERLHACVEQFYLFLQEQEGIKDEPKYRIEDIAYTLQVGRSAMEERVIFIVKDEFDLLEKLQSFLANEESVKDCYHGFVRRKEENLESLLVDEDMSQTIGVWIAKRKFSNLMKLWVEGLVFDWNKLYGEIKPNRINLPTYPFARDRYWISETQGKGIIAMSGAAVSVIHPLLHENTSDLSEQRFSSTFTGKEFFVSDYKVNGERIFPGVVYLEMARAAVEKVSGDIEKRMTLCLKNVEWAQPIVANCSARKVHIGLFGEDTGEVQYEVYTETDNEEDVVVHSQGVAEIMVKEETPTLDIQNLLSQMNQGTLSAEECYQAFKKVGIDYGEGYRGIREIYRVENQVLARLSLPSSVHDTQDEYVLHPSLIDSALQSLIGLMLENSTLSDSNETPLEPSLPIALESLEILSSCTSEMYAWARYSGGSAPLDKVQKLDIDLCDEQGNVCVKMQGFSTRVLEGDVGAPKAKDSIGTLLATPVWKERAVLSSATRQPYAEHQVMLCEMPGIKAKELQSLIPGSHCENLKSEQDQIETRFSEYAVNCFEIIQRLLQKKPQGKVIIQILVVNNLEQSLFAGISGLLKTAALENPKVVGQLIQVESREKREGLAEKLEENKEVPHDAITKYKNGKRFVWTLEELKENEVKADVAFKNKGAFKDKGVYVITGGLGGLGILFTREILREASDAKIILT
ncbi:MAG: hypothetical protein GY941_03015, partial [Planctomycetes bacterium]|nr:hypothetical protein [Planctomycetota bacterium]